MDAGEVIKKLFELADVAFESSDQLVGKGERKATKLAAERRGNDQEVDQIKPKLIPVPEHEHRRNINIVPWELLHLLGAGNGVVRAWFTVKPP